MTKLYHKLPAAISHLCAVLLGLLGFGCSSSSEPEMYGTPTGSFEIKGDVTDESGTPVAEAEVKVFSPDAHSQVNWSIANALTEDNGRYTVAGYSLPPDKLKVVCLPPKGSNLEPDSVFTVMKYVTDEEHKPHGWYWGHAEGVANFKLKKKSAE